MSWWRKKQEVDDQKDDILDLDTVVWRGIAPEERLERLAATADREADIQEGNIPLPPQNNYVPTKPLPSVPLPVQHVTRFVEEEDKPQPEEETSAHLEEEEIIPERILTPEEEMIEADIREQIMAEIAAEIEAELENDDQIVKEITANDPHEAQPQGVTPDVSDAIKSIVADEIGGWLNHNVQRIIAESVTETLSAAKDSSASEQAVEEASEQAPKQAKEEKPEQITKSKTVKAKAPSKKAISKKATAKKTGAKKAAKKAAKSAKAKKSSKSS